MDGLVPWERMAGRRKRKCCLCKSGSHVTGMSSLIVSIFSIQPTDLCACLRHLEQEVHSVSGSACCRTGVRVQNNHSRRWMCLRSTGARGRNSTRPLLATPARRCPWRSCLTQAGAGRRQRALFWNLLRNFKADKLSHYCQEFSANHHHYYFSPFNQNGNHHKFGQKEPKSGTDRVHFWLCHEVAAAGHSLPPCRTWE